MKKWNLSKIYPVEKTNRIKKDCMKRDRRKYDRIKTVRMKNNNLSLCSAFGLTMQNFIILMSKLKNEKFCNLFSL
jgi:hypothetical protein